MKKSGFIATSLIYSFFLVFLAIIAALLSNYIANKTILERYNAELIDNLNREPFYVKFISYNVETHSETGKYGQYLNSETYYLKEDVVYGKSLKVKYVSSNAFSEQDLVCESKSGNWNFENNHTLEVNNTEGALELRNITDDITCTMRW